MIHQGFGLAKMQHRTEEASLLEAYLVRHLRGHEHLTALIAHGLIRHRSITAAPVALCAAM